MEYLNRMYRLVINGNASVYVTGRDMLNGIGDLIKFNDAVKKCFQSFVDLQNQEINPKRLTGIWNDYKLQIDVIEY